MKKYTKFVATAVVAMLMIGCSSTPAKTFEGGEYVSVDGTFLVGKDGALSVTDRTEAKVTIDDFFDPACGACVTYAGEAKEVFTNAIESGDVVVNYHPVMFLNGGQDGAHKDYSLNTAGYVLSVAEHAPKEAGKFVNLILDKEVYEKLQADDFKQSEFIAELFEKLELTEEQIKLIEGDLEMFKQVAIKNTEDFTATDGKWMEFGPLDEEGNPQLFTPFILVNETGKLETMAQTLETLEDIASDLQASIDAILGK